MYFHAMKGGNRKKTEGKLELCQGWMTQPTTTRLGKNP